MYCSSRKRPICFISSSFLLALVPPAWRSVEGFGVSSCSRTTAAIKRSFLSESKLTPEENPEANPDIESRSGVRYGDVLSGLNLLFAPDELDQRNAKSRSDGYWPYISEDCGPPQEFTYGEFDFFFFAELLDRTHVYMTEYNNASCKDWSGKTFVDIGSGMGRLVFAAAALHPSWKLCRGIEVLQGISNAAKENLKRCRLDRTIQQTSCDFTQRNELWIPSLHSPGYTYKTQRRAFSTIGDDEWVDVLQRQVLGEDSEQGNDAAESDKSISNASDSLMDESPDTIWENDITDSSSDSLDDDDTFEAEDEGANNRLKYALHVPSDNPKSTSSPQALPLAPIEFVCGSFEDPFVSFLDADLIFVFSSAFPKHVMDSLSRSIGTKCKPGTIVVTIDYMLHLEGIVEPSISQEYGFDLPTGRYKLELIEETDGWCWLTGGLSTAYIYRVVVSLWEQQEKINHPTLQDRAYQAVKAAEAERTASAERFLSGVYNNIVFHGLPKSWRPKRIRDTLESKS